MVDGKLNAALSAVLEQEKVVKEIKKKLAAEEARRDELAEEVLKIVGDNPAINEAVKLLHPNVKDAVELIPVVQSSRCDIFLMREKGSKVAVLCYGDSKPFCNSTAQKFPAQLRGVVQVQMSVCCLCCAGITSEQIIDVCEDHDIRMVLTHGTDDERKVMGDEIPRFRFVQADDKSLHRVSNFVVSF